MLCYPLIRNDYIGILSGSFLAITTFRAFGIEFWNNPSWAAMSWYLGGKRLNGWKTTLPRQFKKATKIYPTFFRYQSKLPLSYAYVSRTPIMYSSIKLRVTLLLGTAMLALRASAQGIYCDGLRELPAVPILLEGVAIRTMDIYLAQILQFMCINPAEVLLAFPSMILPSHSVNRKSSIRDRIARWNFI